MNWLIRRVKRWQKAQVDFGKQHTLYQETIESLKTIGSITNDQLSEVAHSRPPVSVKPPAFFRHVQLFFPFEKPDPEYVVHAGLFDRKKAVEAIAAFLLKALKDSHDSTDKKTEITKWQENFITVDETEPDKTFVLTLNPFHGFELRLAIDVYSEYATITFILDNRTSAPSLDWCANPEDVATYMREKMTHVLKSGTTSTYRACLTVRLFTSVFGTC